MFSEYGKCYENYDLINYNTYHVSCICKYFIEVDSITKLTKLYKYILEHNLKYLVLGNGSNIILPSFYDGVVIKLNLRDVEFDRNKVIVSSSIKLPQLVDLTINEGFTSLKWAKGIPGTVGGAVITNAGAYNDEIANYVEELEVLENNKVRIIKKSEIDFAYRHSSLKYRDLIILRVTLSLKKGDILEAKNFILEKAKVRKSTQPLDKYTAGSVFKNPEGYSAGKLIDDLGLKGYQIGGAKVSEKHANFIENVSDATGEDIIKLISFIKKEVLHEYNIDLELEQQICV